MRWLVVHWGEKKKHIFDAVVGVLKSWRHDCTWMQRDDETTRARLVEAIASGAYDALLTWQRFFPMQKDIVEAIASTSIRRVYMDYGFLPHYDSVVFDSEGENACSSLRRQWMDASTSSEDESRVDPQVDAILRGYSAAPVGDPPACMELGLIRYPFVLVPLQRPSDSVVRFDSTIRDFAALVRRVLLLAAHRVFVVIKLHPLDADLDLGVPDHIPGSHLILRTRHGDLNERICDYLLSQAALVVGINSNMLFRALLHGRPVIACGEGWYSGSGAVHEVNGVSGLTSLSTPAINWAARRKYIAACLSQQVHVRDLSNPERIRMVLDTIGVELPGQAEAVR